MTAARTFYEIGSGAKNLAIGLLIVGAVAGAVFVVRKIWTNRDLVNPASDKNVVHQSVNNILGFDNQTNSVGSALFDGVEKVKSIADDLLGFLPFYDSEEEKKEIQYRNKLNETAKSLEFD